MVGIPANYIGGDPGRIAIKFFNGNEVVVGFIVKQSGSRRYVVSDGIKQWTVSLVRTLSDLQNMGDGMATIEIFPFINGEISDTPEHIQRFDQFTCYTIEGHRYGWRFEKPFEVGVGKGADQDGEGNIAQLPS
jgi:hypothetical protein